MKKWGPFVLTFLAGLLIGGAVCFHMIGARGPEGRERRNQRMIKMFSRKLELTPAQKEQFVKIMTATREKMEGLRAKARPEFDAIRAGTREEIRKILTPQQMEKFNALEQKAEERRKKRNEQRP